MEILKTSKFIKTMFEDEINNGSMEESDIDFKHETELLFKSFSTNKILKIDFGTVNDFISKFDIFYKENIFKTFNKPSPQEYFCQQLNFFLLIDFILTFFKIDNSEFDIKYINTEFLFDFFTKLGDFFSFMNYLDVDEDFINYIKIMIVLYLLHLDRDVIERHFYHNIEILDNYFVNVVMTELFKHINYNDMNNLFNRIDKFESILQNHHLHKNYNKDEYLFLNDLFYYNTYDSSLSVQHETITIPNPAPRPTRYVHDNRYGNNNDGTLYYDSDDDNFVYYDSDDNEFRYRNRAWTPMITKCVPKIDKSDPNYEFYKNMFIYSIYKPLYDKYNQLLKEVRNLCSSIQIKKYDNFLPDNNELDIIKVKTIIGIYPNLLTIDNKEIQSSIYSIACEFGIASVATQYASIHKLDLFETSMAKASPNTELSGIVLTISLKR